MADPLITTPPTVDGRSIEAYLGANAIVDVDIDDETIGGSMLMVTASGTAVRLG